MLGKRMSVKVLYKVTEGASVPSYESAGAAGMDIKALIPQTDIGTTAILVNPGESRVIPTGLFVQIPVGYEIQVRSRSGLAAKYGILVLNSPGTIDSDYRGEIKVILHNSGKDSFIVGNGDRIAQLVLCPVVQAEMVATDEFDKTERGAGGFGSTGV